MIPTPLPILENPCGGCTACCTVLAVQELGKPAHSRCQYLGESGCTNYDCRPASCRNWSCLWAIGFTPGDHRFRPDRVGLLFDMMALPSGAFVVAYEVWEGASEQADGMSL